MPTLVLIRHSKTEPDRGDDRARRLTDRGREDAAQLRTWLVEQGVDPEQVVVSPAARARETWELGSVGAVAPRYDDRVYQASVDELREVVAETPPSVRCLVLVGHNPAIERLAWELDDRDEARQRTDRGMSTSGVAVVELAAWTDRHGLLAAFR